MEPVHGEACSHQLHLHLWVFPWFRTSLWRSPRGLHSTNHCAYRSYGDAFEHPFNVVSCTSIRWCWPHSCGNYVGRSQNWISSHSEEQIWLEKLPNQICSRPVECNASCLVNLRTWKHFLMGQFRGLPWFQWIAIELPHVLHLWRSFGVRFILLPCTLRKVCSLWLTRNISTNW